MAEHASHDPELVAAAADRTGRLAGLMAACVDCLRLVGELRTLAAATPSGAIPRRPRDYRLSLEQAARLRRRGWRRLFDAIGTSRDIVTRPLAMSLTTLGLAGLLLASMPAALPFAAADQGEVARPLQTTEVLDTRGSGMAAPPSVDDGPAATDPGQPLRLMALTFLGLGAGIIVLRRAAAASRGLR